MAMNPQSMGIQEIVRRAERKNRDDFYKLMKEHAARGRLTAKTHWHDYYMEVKESPTYLAVAANTSGATPEDLFDDVVEELQKQEIVRRAERKNRDEFYKLMKEHAAGGRLTAKTHWHDYYTKVKETPTYLAVASNTSGAAPEDLFDDVVEELQKQTPRPPVAPLCPQISSSSVPMPDPVEKIQSDWIEAPSSDGKRFYYNKRTKLSSWNKPPELMTPAEEAKMSFLALLETAEIGPYGTWNDAMSLITYDQRYGPYGALTLGELKQIFKEFLVQKQKQEEERLKSSSRGSKRITIIEDDEAYKAVERVDDHEDLSKDYTLESEKEKIRRAESRNRNEFCKLLKEHIAAGTLSAKTHWHDYYTKVKESPTYLAVASNTSGSTPEDLFDDIVGPQLQKQLDPVEKVPSDWIEGISSSGKRLYYNKRTKLSSWNKPPELMTPAEMADASNDWMEARCPDGTKYYYNRVTKQSVWTTPDELKFKEELTSSSRGR